MGGKDIILQIAFFWMLSLPNTERLVVLSGYVQLLLEFEIGSGCFYKNIKCDQNNFVIKFSMS